WFASVQFAKHNIHFGAVGIGPAVPGIHISIWLLIPLAGIVTAFIGVVIGLPTLRLRGDYLAIVTLGFGEILPQVARNGDSLGGAWIAIREDEIAAAAMGIPLMRTKTWAYASGAFFGGVAGAFFASFKSSTFPNDFSFNISAFILSMVILGGMGNVWGVIVGGAVLAYLNQEGLANIGSKIGIPDVPLYSSGTFGPI